MYFKKTRMLARGTAVRPVLRKLMLGLMLALSWVKANTPVLFTYTTLLTWHRSEHVTHEHGWRAHAAGGAPTVAGATVPIY